MEGRQAGMAGEPRALPLRRDRHGVVEEVLADHLRPRPAEAPPLACRGGRSSGSRSAPGKREAHFGMRQRQPPHHLGHRLRLGAVGAQEFQPRRRGEEEVAAPRSACRWRGLPARARSFAPPSTSIAQPCSSVACRDSIESRATAPMEASASPRKPSVAIGGKVVAGELRRAVARDREREVVAPHADRRRRRRGSGSCRRRR